MERFADDEKEVMSRKGMGVLYTHCDDGSLMRTVFPKLRQTILERYYIPHHRRLAMQVARDLNLSGMAMIVDCHSFPDTPLERDLVQSKPRPDINIGTDNFHTPVELIEFAKSYFAERRLVVDVDSPYSGTIVPSEYYQKNRAVFSIMIEVNRRLYLEPLTNEKCADFLKMKSMITEFLLLLKTFDQWITK